MQENIRKQENWNPPRSLFPFLSNKNFTEELAEEDNTKVNLFEKGLANELKKSDTIDEAVHKIVKMALAAEFGPSLVAAVGAKAMVATICRGILSDAQLRKQALIIIDRFAHA